MDLCDSDAGVQNRTRDAGETEDFYGVQTDWNVVDPD